MALSPLDIRTQSFTRRMRGFDTDEVGAFLSILAEHYDDLQREVRHSASRIADLEAKLVHYERIEDALQEALRTARESQRSALDTAAQQAEQIRTEARLEARGVVQEAEHDRNRLRQEAQAIGARRKEIVARLRAFLMSEMEMLAHFEGEDPIGFIQLRRDTAASLGPSAPLGGTLGTYESDAAITARRPPAAPTSAPAPAERPTADDLWAAPSATGDVADAVEALPVVPGAAPAVAEQEEAPDLAPEQENASGDASAPYTARLAVEDPGAGPEDAAAADWDQASPEAETAPFEGPPEGPSGVNEGAELEAEATAEERARAWDWQAPHDAERAPAEPFDAAPEPTLVPSPVFAPEPAEAPIPESPADDASPDEPMLVRPSWMDDVPDDLLAAPLVDEATPDALPTAPSPLAERLARAAAETTPAPVEAQNPVAQNPVAQNPVAPILAAPVPPARPRYVVTSFLGDDEAADVPPAAPQAESEEIARVRRLLDGLG